MDTKEQSSSDASDTKHPVGVYVSGAIVGESATAEDRMRLLQADVFGDLDDYVDLTMDGEQHVFVNVVNGSSGHKHTSDPQVQIGVYVSGAIVGEFATAEDRMRLLQADVFGDLDDYVDLTMDDEQRGVFVSGAIVGKFVPTGDQRPLLQAEVFGDLDEYVDLTTEGDQYGVFVNGIIVEKLAPAGDQMPLLQAEVFRDHGECVDLTTEGDQCNGFEDLGAVNEDEEDDEIIVLYEKL